MSQARKIYDALVESGELTTLYTSMTGNWSKDRVKFTRQYEDNEKLIKGAKNFNIDDFDEVDEY